MSLTLLGRPFVRDVTFVPWLVGVMPLIFVMVPALENVTDEHSMIRLRGPVSLFDVMDLTFPVTSNRERSSAVCADAMAVMLKKQWPELILVLL
mgnify:CR=1 FL=1